MAHKYTLCDNFFHSAFGGSFLNHMWLIAAAYKRFEWAAEYFDPAATRTVNGPPVQEVELSGVVIDPGGLQVIEDQEHAGAVGYVCLRAAGGRANYI